MNSLASIIGSNFIVVMLSGVTHTINADHAHYSKIREALKLKNYDEVERLINIKQSVINFSQGSVTVRDGEVFYGDMPLRGSVVNRILDMIRENFDAQPMLRFLNNLMQNPSKRAVDELYGFLEETALPITEDGCFLAYKKVRDDYRDFYTGKMDNSVGTILEMPRNQVDEDKDTTCSYGLHFCSLSYLPHYHGGHGRVMIVKINPADVVAIPSDYNNAKGRAARYEIIGEHTSEHNEAFTSPVYRGVEPVDPDEHDDEDDYELGYEAGADRAESDSQNLNAYDTTLKADVSEGYAQGYVDGYGDNYFVDWKEAGYENGEHDADAGNGYDDTPVAGCDDNDEYREGYADGWHEAKIASI